MNFQVQINFSPNLNFDLSTLGPTFFTQKNQIKEEKKNEPNQTGENREPIQRQYSNDF